MSKVVDGFSASGQPVGSKALAEDPAISCGPSTIRNELAVLEEHGLLAHPHTSAGRVPTDAGYRYYVDRILPSLPTAELTPRTVQPLALVHREIDAAMRTTSEALSQVTNLLAIVSAPPLQSTTIRHVEMLLLQPHVLMVVVITSTGGVAKRVFSFEEPVDSGLADWAASFLNEKLVGLGLGARMLHSRISDPGLQPTERAFVQRLSPAFTDLEQAAGDDLYVEGAGRLLAGCHWQDVSQLNALLELLERKRALLGVLKTALSTRGTYVRIGSENTDPALRSLALVGANYGLPQRNLGTVSVIGPTRMNYATTMRAVRETALRLSRFVEDVYEDA